MSAILETLLARYHGTFKPAAYHEETGGMRDLVTNDQHPEMLIVSCIDSRAAPGVIFKMHPGEALDHSHIAGIVPRYNPLWGHGDVEVPSVAASIDFAVDVKGVPCVVIMGHTHCGGIKACVEGTSSPLIQAWMKHAVPALEKLDLTQDKESILRQAERACVRHSYRNLLTYPAIRDAVNHRGLKIEAWLNDLEHGHLYRYDPDGDAFVELAAKAIHPIHALPFSVLHQQCG